MQLILRKWLQFSLRTFLVLISVTAFVGGLLWIKHRDNREFETRRDHWFSLGYKLEVEETPIWFGLHSRLKIVGLWTDERSDYFLINQRVQLTGIESEQDLKRVSISTNGVSDEACAMLATLQNLEKLDLYDSQITVATVEKLSRLPKLIQLTLQHSFTMEKECIEKLNRFPALQELSVNSCPLLSEAKDRLAIPTLKSLDISACYPDQLDISQKDLGRMPHLEVLIAHSNQIKKLITDETVLDLRLLDLRENPLESLGGLAQAAPQLEYLYVDEDDLSPQLVSEIHQLKSLKQLIIGAGHRNTAYYFGKRSEVERRLPEIRAKFDVSVILEDAPFSRDRKEPKFNWPGHFEPELSLIQAQNCWK